MRVARFLGWFLLPLGLTPGLAAQLVTIDFENVAGPSLFDSAEPPLQIQSATFSGGEVLTNATFAPADESSIYGTAAFCNGCLPTITMSFSQRVSNLSFLLMNGNTIVVTYVIEDDEGSTQVVTLPENFNEGAAVVTVPDQNVRSVSISGDAGDWDFAIDNVVFTLAGPVLIDPIAGGLLAGFTVSSDPETLAAATAFVQGVAADGTALVLVRIPATQSGQNLTVTVINDQGAPSDSTDDDGGLAQLGNATLPASQIAVAAVDTSQGPMAFALYRAPVSFSRGPGDESQVLRSVTLTANENSGLTSKVSVSVLRPPVVLIHGLWDSDVTWDGFSPLIADERFFVYRVNYSGYVLGGILSTPFYPPAKLLLTRQNALGFAFNAGPALLQVQNFVANFSHDQNVAAVQADVVAHSMGGDISRTMVLQHGFLSATDYGYGPIHKLITIGTPHLGTPLATQLLADQNSCVRDLMATLGQVALDNILIVGAGTVNGAVGDLAGDGTRDGSLSPALSSLLARQPFPTAYVSGQMGAGNLAGLNCTFCAAGVIRGICGTLGSSLAQDLTSTAWPSVFGQASDAIVPLTSQENGATAPVQATGVVHSGGAEKLDFGAPAELDAASGIPAQVIDLLNEKVNGIHFHF